MENEFLFYKGNGDPCGCYWSHKLHITSLCEDHKETGLHYNGGYYVGMIVEGNDYYAKIIKITETRIFCEILKEDSFLAGNFIRQPHIRDCYLIEKVPSKTVKEQIPIYANSDSIDVLKHTLKVGSSSVTTFNILLFFEKLENTKELFKIEIDKTTNWNWDTGRWE